MSHNRAKVGVGLAASGLAAIAAWFAISAMPASVETTTSSPRLAEGPAGSGLPLAPNSPPERHEVVELDGPGTAAAPEPVPDAATRVISGVVRDALGPLQEGGVAILHPERVRRGDYEDISCAIGADGAFRLELPAEIHGQPVVMVNIYDGFSMVFAGTLPVRENLDVFVVSSRTDPDPLEGELVLPHAPPGARWGVAVFGYADRSCFVIGGSGDGRTLTGTGAKFRLNRHSAVLREVDGPIVMIAHEEDGREIVSPDYYHRVFGHAVFGSLRELVGAFRNRIVIEAPERRFEFVSEDEPAEKVIARPVISAQAFYMGRQDGDRRWTFHIPDGEYHLAGKLPDGARRTAQVTVVSNQRDYRVEWAHAWPGPNTIDVLVVDADERPVPGAKVRYGTTGSEMELHSGRAFVDEEGRARIDGLLSMDYLFQAGDSVGSILGYSTANPADTRSLTLTITRLGTIAVVPDNVHALLGERLDAADCQLWWRDADAGGEWVRVPVRERIYDAFTVHGVPSGHRVDVALEGEWWSGHQRVRVGEQLTTARVLLEPLVALSGVVEGEGVSGRERVRWVAGEADAALPWQSGRVDATGKFSLRAPIDRLESGELVVERGGEVVGRQQVSGDRTESIRIALHRAGGGEPR